MQVVKSVSTKQTDNKYGIFGEPDDSEYGILKEKFVKGDFPKDKLFIYTSKACDNLIDRSDECFSGNALKEIAELIVGKPCITDHEHDLEGQYARVYKAEVVTDDTRENEFGEKYQYVLAYCYMVNNEKNKYIIDDISSGIRKEVSVGCSVSSCKCSVCGAEMNGVTCNHVIGKVYNGKQCARVLDKVDDFYELSSVPVPCQREAGVIKQFKEETSMAITVDKAFLEIGKLPGINSEALNVIKSEISRLSNPDIIAKDNTIKSLEKELTEKQVKIKELEQEIDSNKKMGAYKELFSELVPKSKEAEDILVGLLDANMKPDDDGVYSIPDETKEMLRTKYNFLFDEMNMGDDEEEEDMEKEETDENMEKAEDIEDKPMDKSKSIKFTNSVSIKSYGQNNINPRVLKNLNK